MKAIFKGSVERSANFKGALRAGVISRQEYEKVTTSAADVQVKVDEVRKQIATTEGTIAEARREPAPNELPDVGMAGFSQTLWTTGNARIDTLIRQTGALWCRSVSCLLRNKSGVALSYDCVEPERSLGPDAIDARNSGAIRGHECI